jgi:hypothetical protein
MREMGPNPLTNRWALVEARLRTESRAMTDEQKLTQLASLMAAVDDFGWRAALGEDDARVRALWTRLRAAAQTGR